MEAENLRTGSSSEIRVLPSQIPGDTFTDTGELDTIWIPLGVQSFCKGFSALDYGDNHTDRADYLLLLLFSPINTAREGRDPALLSP
jgi:hypothetical protein